MNNFTREQILDMEPGKEMDAMIDRIMRSEEATTVLDSMTWHTPAGEVERPCPKYSTDIPAVWSVEAKFIEKDSVHYVNCLAQAVWNGDGADYIECADPDDTYTTKCLHELIHATPEQRCKAALLAVMGI